MKRDYEQAAHSITTLAFRLKKTAIFQYQASKLKQPI